MADVDTELSNEYRVLVDRLRATFDSGVTRPLDWRRGQLDAMKRMIEENEGVITETLAADLRKPPQEVVLGETALLYAEIKHARSRLERWARPRKVETPLFAMPAVSRIVPEPLGVALIIGAWNYPLQLALAPLIPAIAAGNCAVIKPSEITPYTSKMIANLIPRYMDRSAFAVVEGGVAPTTALLAQRWDHLVYTGGAAVGPLVL